MSNWEICRFLFLVFSSFRPAGDQLIQLDRSRCQMHLHQRACGSLLFLCAYLGGITVSPGGRPAYSAGPKQVPNAPAPTSLRLFTFLLFACLGAITVSPGGRPAYSAGPKQVPNAPAPTSLRLFTFFCLRVLKLSRFRPAGDQLIQLDRSRCQTHLPHEPAALFFILESLRFKIKSTVLVVFIDHRSVFLSKSCVFYGTLFANLLYLW